jgi:hypothetical protein
MVKKIMFFVFVLFVLLLITNNGVYSQEITQNQNIERIDVLENNNSNELLHSKPLVIYDRKKGRILFLK